MVTEDSVMLVIGASRPNFRNDQDKLAFAVHSSFLAAGYVLTATGHPAFADNSLSSSSLNDEVGIDHWNEVENNYAFLYKNPNKGNKKVLVKCLVIGDKLLVNALLDGITLPMPVHLGISVDDYVTKTAASDYPAQYKNLGKLVSNLELYVLSKLDGLLSRDSVTAPSSSQGTQVMQQGDILERDPTGRFAKYSLIIPRHGASSKKDVYLGIDEVTGVEVYWCTIPGDEIEQKKNEPKMLQSLQHQNIMKCYSYWTDDNSLKSVHMITEAFSSENLRDYSLIHDLVGNIETMKKWCQQILSALEYLHNQNPPVIHRDLNPQNIFINGTTGKVKLVEFGLAVRLEEGANLQEFADAAIEYMAPEVLILEYNQLADIYSFGMCVLQMMSKEKIYSEYRNHAEIETKIKEGVRPAALDAVTDYETREFIRSCLVPRHERPTASTLLRCAFIATGEVAGIPTGESNRAVAEADQRRREIDVGSRRKHVWRQRLSKLSSVFGKNRRS